MVGENYYWHRIELNRNESVLVATEEEKDMGGRRATGGCHTVSAVAFNARVVGFTRPQFLLH